MTIHKQEVVKKPKRGMSRARKAHLSRLAKMRWAAKRAATATVAVTQPTTPSADSSDFKLGFIKGIMYTMGALEA